MWTMAAATPSESDIARRSPSTSPPFGPSSRRSARSVPALEQDDRVRHRLRRQRSGEHLRRPPRPSAGLLQLTPPDAMAFLAWSPNRPRKCTPMGTSIGVPHSGTDIAGLPVMLAITPEYATVRPPRSKDSAAGSVSVETISPSGTWRFRQRRGQPRVDAGEELSHPPRIGLGVLDREEVAAAVTWRPGADRPSGGGRTGRRGPRQRIEGAADGGFGDIGEASVRAGVAPQPGEGLGQVDAGAL